LKILHTSDWHLGRRPVGGLNEYSNTRYKDYFDGAKYIVTKAIENNVDVFIIAGDLFDRSSILPDMLFKTEKLLEELKNNSVKTLLIEGNHDKVYSYDDSWIDYLERKDLVRVPKFQKNGDKYLFLPIVIKDIKFYGVPYQGVLIDEVLTELSKQLKSDQKNIVIVHTGIGGDFIPGCTKRDVIDLFKGKVIYMAGGHLHTYKEYPKEEPYFFVPGCPEYWDLNEGEEKGFIIFDTQSLKHTFYSSKRRKLSSYKFKASEVMEKVEDLTVEDSEIVKIKILNDSKHLVDTDKIEKILKGKGALKVDISVEYIENEKYNSLDRLNKSDIEKIVIGSWENIYSKNVEKTLKYLEILKSEDNDNEIIESFDTFLDSIIREEKNEDR
jgi:exonuclease SbcD